MQATQSITLMNLLAARDNRAAKERELQRQYPSETLVVLTIVMPGSVKRNTDTAVIATAACEEITTAFNIRHSEQFDLDTGFEAYFICDNSPEICKKKACHIEDTHPLGRFFDIDIIAGNCTPLSRSQLNTAPRKCMLCDNDARVCMRLGTHSYEDILHHIHTTVSQYVGR